jgi:RimJ/RimL family protein N-acetyltransferase
MKTEYSKELKAYHSLILQLKSWNKIAGEFPDYLWLQHEDIRVGTLYPFSFNDFQNEEKIALLVEWRNNNREFFVSKNEVNRESTAGWLKNSILQNPNRELFWILNLEDSPVGHIGIKYDVQRDWYEIDSVLRGVSSNHGIMRSSVLCIEELVVSQFDIKELVLRVLVSNTHARDFYSHLGYSKIDLANDSIEDVTDLEGTLLMRKEL